MRALRAAVVVIALALLSPPRSSAAAGDLPPETGLGAGQVLIGTATASLALALPVFTVGSPFEMVAYGLLAAAPAAVGGMVCTLGQTSKHYVGRCGPVVGGAYIGVLAAIPLALIGSAAGHSSFDGGDEGGRNFTSGGAIGFALGYAIGSAVGATLAWHLRKEERNVWSGLAAPPAPPPAEAQAWPELRWRPARGAGSGLIVGAPVMTLVF